MRHLFLLSLMVLAQACLALDIKESNSTVTTSATAIDFGSGFDVIDSPTGEGNVVLDLTELGGFTLGNGSNFTLTFDAGATDPTINFQSGFIRFTPGGGDFQVLNDEFQINSTAPIIKLVDSTASAVPFQIKVDANTYSVLHNSGSPVYLSMADAGAITLGNNTTTGINLTTNSGTITATGNLSVTGSITAAGGGTERISGANGEYTDYDDGGDGTITRGGAGGTWNECIAEDFESGGSNFVKLSSTCGTSTYQTALSWRFEDEVQLQLGTGAEGRFFYNDAVDDQFLFTTTKTGSAAITDPMFEFLVDYGTSNGTGMTANQEVFGVSKGTQAGNIPLLTVDEDGDVVTGGGLQTKCIMVRDTDDAGWTEINALNGALSPTIDSDGICDGS